ncbi:hypothetical protein J4427_01835 [Candidatus Woesearchaeota archaeon]|nr:hypothetical protein [Candidatus Woesearchaeota archaeon]
MKKAVSPLVAYILLIGMVVTSGVMVGNYLIKQAKTISFESKEIEVYCSEVAIDAIPICKIDIAGSYANLKLNLTNRGYYNVSNLTIIIAYYPYNDLGGFFMEGSNRLQIPIRPGKKALLEVVINKTARTEITITPSIGFGDKIASCNEKVFKVELTPSIINGLGTICP